MQLICFASKFPNDQQNFIYHGMVGEISLDESHVNPLSDFDIHTVWNPKIINDVTLDLLITWKKQDSTKQIDVFVDNNFIGSTMQHFFVVKDFQLTNQLVFVQIKASNFELAKYVTIKHI